jgi:tetratricopeptide (TPR) repeat protein
MGFGMKPSAAFRRLFRRGSANPRAAILKKAQAAKTEHDWRGAAELYRQALALRDAFGTRVQLGHMLKEAGELEAAEAEYLRALTMKPEDSDLHLQIGHFYFVKGEPDESVRFYRKAVELAPGDAGLQEALRIGERRAADAPFASALDEAMAAMATGRWRDAEEGFSVLQAAGRADYLGLQGHAVKEQGRLEEAADLYRAYAVYAADEGETAAYAAQLQLAQGLQLTGRFSEAAVCFAAARDLRMAREGWTGSVDELLEEIQNCLKRVHPSLDPGFIR